jgi:PKD repeat protein
VTIDPNVIQTTGVGIFLYSSSDILIEANTISAPDMVNPSDIGIHIQSCTDIDIIGNTILNFTAGPKSGYTYGTTGAGINILASKAINVSLSNLRNNTVGVVVQRLDLTTEPREIDIHYNNLEHNTEFGVLNCYTWIGKDKTYTPTNASYVVNATHNWWGHETGPYHPTSWEYLGKPYGPHYGLGGNVSDHVLYYPWLSEPSGPPVEPPTASFMYSPSDPEVNETITFDASSSTPNGGTIVSYTWNFGDGNVTTTPSSIIKHVYKNIGTYNVTLTVIDSEGLTDSTWKICAVVFVVHDVAVTDVQVSPNEVYQRWNVSISVTVANLGEESETFTLTIYYDNNIILTHLIQNLGPEKTLTLNFSWNTKDVAYCHNYTIKASASIVPRESNTNNNSYINGHVKVRIIGDVDGNGAVNVLDLIKASLVFDKTPSDPEWNKFCDINQDNQVNVLDFILIAVHLGESC